MKLSVVSVMFAICNRVESFAVSDVISNYAKVSVNDGSQHNVTTISPTTTSEISKNETEDEIPEYSDFDDDSAAPERSTKSSSSYDSDTMMKYFNGFVNLLALMYKFSGKSEDLRPQSLHFSKSRPRSSDGLANSVNQLAEDRYNPTTATKKFKAKQGAYSTMNVFPVYSPSTAAETYSSNDGKTSYDADSSQYMISNPEDSDKKENTMDNSYKQKSPMTDYMTQNDPVEIQHSYSYEIPQDPPKVPEDHHDEVQPWNPPAAEPVRDPSYFPWMSSGSKKQPKEENSPWSGDDKEKPSGPVYYPWMDSLKKKMKPPPAALVDDEDDSPPLDSYMPPKSKKVKDELYYPWLSSKKPVPPPEEEDEETPDDLDASSWGMKPPMKSKPPKDLDDVSPYLYDHDDHHGVVYHDDPHHHDFEEEDHHLKDEDRESKRPYTYYHLGRKLWYVPLLFSLYFIVYIASLILKSIARHKVQFPEKLWELHDHHDHHHGDHGRLGRQLDEVTEKVFDSLEKAKNKFM